MKCPAVGGDPATDGIWDELAAREPIDPATLRLVLADQRSASRRWLYPVLRPVCNALVALAVVARRLVPGRLTAHGLMDALCVWFLRRCVSPVAGELLVRHFVVETNLLVFVARNTGLPGVPEVTLRPAGLRRLGDRAVIEHDVNVYEVLGALGRREFSPVRPEALDTTMLTVGPVDAEPGTRRLLRLDIQSALCLMNIPFALCLSAAQYRRAVHSLRLDTHLMAVLSDLTGDPVFRTWSPPGVAVRVDSRLEVPRAVYEHAVFCEYAHERLLRGTPSPATVRRVAGVEESQPV
ncbi:DUF6999 family protein [Dactylosporangium sp. CA-233914]|uniref:DUF6999 family protein n=1 Tax=Dactylosporangium sp. CA-233914 TaxID=3239934 RepID=UPI003D934ABA